MNLYHVVSTYHLLNAIVHKVLSNQPGILVVSQWIVEKFPKYKQLEAYFERVVMCEVNYGFFHSEAETERYLLGITGKLEEYDEVYLWASQYSLGVYMAEKRLPFVFGEDGAGLLSRPEILEDIVKKTDPKVFERNCKLGLYSGKAASITKRLCNVKAQVEGFRRTEDILDFDVVAEMLKIPEERCAEIISFFTQMRNIPMEKDAVLLLTQHFANLLVMEFEDQALIYQLLVDYFFQEKNLVVKPHPDDLMYYSKLFRDAQIIREKFPSEFMPFVFDHQPQCVATISSTAIYNLRGHYPQVFELDTRYEKNFLMTHRYYAAVCMAKRLGLDIACIGANDLLVKRLCETMGKNAPSVLTDAQSDAPCLYLVDDVTEAGEEGRMDILNRLLALDEKSCVLFINSKADYCWYSYEHKALWDRIVPMVLKKKAIREQDEDFYAPMDEEILYAYSKNEELLKMIKETEIKKDLPHVGVCVESETMTPEQEKIRMLEGILAATEKRLLYYIEKEERK